LQRHNLNARPGAFDKLIEWIYILYCFEIGFFLIVCPWTSLWESNYILYRFPFLQAIFLNNFFKGSVSGLGLVDLFIGGMEVSNYLKRTGKSHRF
jgi:hypothetical protein